MKVRSMIIDAELVALQDDGRPDFLALQRSDRTRPLAAWCFDFSMARTCGSNHLS
jgi:ATP-dependent DNA ligase